MSSGVIISLFIGWLGIVLFLIFCLIRIKKGKKIINIPLIILLIISFTSIGVTIGLNIYQKSDSKNTVLNNDNKVVSETVDSENKDNSNLNLQKTDSETTLNSNEYIIVDSDKRKISKEEINNFDLSTLSLARNEIFARHGYVFSVPEIKSYFQIKKWYKPVPNFNADNLNDVEKYNIELIKNKENQLNRTNNVNVESSSIDKGNLRGIITWQYNKLIGTKPDVNAKIYLISENYNKNTMTNDEESLFTLLGSVSEDKKDKLFFSKINGYGNYEIDNIPVGKYLMIIISNNTTRPPDLVGEFETAKSILTPYINDWDKFKLVNLSKNKSEFKIINIMKNETIDISHDFGYTYNQVAKTKLLSFWI